MVDEQANQDSVSYELGLKLRDLEQGQKLTKERLLLISKNLIESQEKNIEDITQLKKQVQTLTTNLERSKEIISSLSQEISKSARKEEIAILTRQFKMFEPLNYVRIEDIEKVINEKVNKQHNQSNKKDDDKHNFWEGKI